MHSDEDDEVDGDEHVGDDRAACGAGSARMTFWAPDLVHSGQWKPTDAWCMQLGQIGRSQRWQMTPALRSPWR